MIDPIKDVTKVCPCWIETKDGQKRRCDAPLGVEGDMFNMLFSFVSARSKGSVAWNDIKAFESIADPKQRIER